VTLTVITAVALLAGAVDPTSARAIAHRNEELLSSGEAALADGDAATALARALAVNAADRRLSHARHLLLRGRARARLGLADDAARDLRAARAGLAPTDERTPQIGREIATVERSRGAFDACADELIAVERSAPLSDDDAVLLATCLRGTSRATDAHDVLRGRTANAARSLRARALLEDGLPLLAREDVAVLLPGLAAADLLAFAQAFRTAGDVRYARALVDAAVARFPEDVDVAAALAAADDGGTRAARAAWLVDGLADRLRLDGRAPAAWRAALSGDDAGRLRARLALLVDDRSWDRVVALAPRLRAAGLVDDEVAYALSFAAFSVGQLDDADAALDGVASAAGFARATELRAAIAACRAAVLADDPEEKERMCPR
jgi:hypothetical protein